MSTAPIVLTETLLEGTTGVYAFTIPINMGFLTTLTLTIYDLDTEQIMNGRDHLDVLNANGGTVTMDIGPPPITTVQYEIVPAETVILNDARSVEHRVLMFQWTWASGLRAAAHVVQFGVENLDLVP